MATICLARSSNSTASMKEFLSGGSRRPPRTPRTAGGFSGRRFCRIFPCGDQWLLQLEQGGWSRSAGEDESHKTFPTLTAAIAYAVQRGLNYRVVHVPIAAADARGYTPVPPKNSGGGVLTAGWPVLTRKTGGPMGAQHREFRGCRSTGG
jgi:hypothetical protein